ncbi:MAG: hypothetical protein Q9201_000672 [Fulgogasparrea decipioides]
MGQNSSKPPPSSTQHVFKSTRAKDLELHIQRRVHSELARLDAEHSKRLAELKEQISAAPDSTTESIHPDARTPDQSTSPGGPDHKAAAQGDKLRELSRASVQKEIEMLQDKLKRRRLKEEVVKDKAVEKAKGEVVNCLRVNDRRPLDCWREVEAFKEEVGRLEREFLGKIMG